MITPEQGQLVEEEYDSRDIHQTVTGDKAEGEPTQAQHQADRELEYSLLRPCQK